MASAFNVSGLTDYVKTNADLLIKNVMFPGLEGKTLDRCAKQLGVVTKARLNYFNIEPTIQDGKGCGFSASGSTVLSDRDVEVAIMKINDEWCPDDLLGKFYENEVAIAAGKERLPFEQEISNGIVKGINKQMEKIAWQGVKANDLVDGFLTLAAGADSASTVTVSIASGTSVYNAIKAVVMAIPEEIIDKAFVGVAPAIYRKFIDELVEKNLYHYESGKQEADSFNFPGTDIPVVKIAGLAGDKRHLYASSWDNLVYATDGMNDKEEFKLWFSDDADLFRLKVRWSAGFATYFPDLVILGTAAADLV